MFPAINYDQLRVFNTTSNDENKAKDISFLDKFRNVFIPPNRPQAGIPNKATKSFEASHAHLGRPRSRFAAKKSRISLQVAVDPPTVYDNPKLHDIRLHISRLRKSGEVTNAEQLEGEDLVLNREKNILTLRNLLKKLPFERTRKENNTVFKAMRDLWPTELSVLFENSKHGMLVLHQLATVAKMDTIPESGFTVFGNSGLYMVLKGSVYPQTLPFLRRTVDLACNNNEEFSCPTPITRNKHLKLHVGDWFGTLVKVEGREVNSKVLTLLATEPCHFLKISTADYKRIILKIRQQIEDEKTSAVHACPFYLNWPELSVRKLATYIEWKKFPPGSVIVEEGEISPFVVFIRHGECNVFKQVEALKTLQNGRQFRVFKSVLLGHFGAGESIGEHSILEGKAMACSVVSQTELDTGIITPEKLQLLDVTTRTLLWQTVGPRFDNFTDEEIQANFIEQEMKEDWDRMKHKVLLDSINYCGIRPGYGKWSHGRKHSPFRFGSVQL